MTEYEQEKLELLRKIADSLETIASEGIMTFEQNRQVCEIVKE